MNLKLFSYVVITIAMLIQPSSVKADIRTMYEQGRWSMSAGLNNIGVQTCMIGTTWPDGRNLSIIWFAGTSWLTVRISKFGWDIPRNIHPQISFSFDNRNPWTANSNTVTPSMIEFTVTNDNIVNFMHEAQLANTMVITFTGSETPWYVGLSGLQDVSSHMINCIKAHDTQPY